MPRARLSKRLPDADAIRLFAEHHISQVRRRKNGEILAVKHVAYGWISPGTFYALQKVHDTMPLIEKVIEGGYRLKWALAQITVEDIPVIGTALYGWALARILLHFTAPDLVSRDEAALLAVGVFAPYGEVLLLWLIAQNTLGLSGKLEGILGPVLGKLWDILTFSGTAEMGTAPSEQAGR